jgi:4-hydroxy-tetrahydrodipicolinate synthase
MIKTRRLEGIVPVLLTPLTKDEKIDSIGLKKLLNYLMEKKIGGIWALGTGSEDMNLTFEKRLQIAQMVCESVANKMPVILGAGFFAMEDILNFIKETEHLEFDAYHVMPYHPLLSLDRLEWFYNRIADKCLKPLWMYTSGNWSRSITPRFVENLKQHPNIAGIKFSNKDAVALTKVINLADDSFQVITAVAAQLFACMSIGSKAHTSSLGSCLPDVLIDIYDTFQKGKIEEALEKQNKLNKFLEELTKNTKMDNFLQAADEKYILKLKGICDEYVTSYYRKINKKEMDNTKKLLNDYSYI